MLIILSTLILTIAVLKSSTAAEAQSGLAALQGAQRVIGDISFASLMVFINDLFSLNSLGVKYTWHLGMYLDVVWIAGGMFVAALRVVPQTAMPATVVPSPGCPPPPPTITFTCPGCSRPLPSDARFCTQCGKTIVTQCPVCKKPCAPDAKFCKHCGEAFGG